MSEPEPTPLTLADRARRDVVDQLRHAADVLEGMPETRLADVLTRLAGTLADLEREVSGRVAAP